MSEYIVTCDEETAAWIGNDVDSMQPIVRCRDCERQWVFDLSNTYGTHEHDQMYCALTVGYSRLVMPDGFCAWGERRAE